jgi:hypothetical protein
MQPHFLDGLVVPTPWGQRTIRVTDVNADAGEVQTISYSFVEDPAVVYRLMVAPQLLVTHPAELRALVSQWTSAGHPNGSDQRLTLEAVQPARDAIVLPRGAPGTTEG